ncbi:MAG: VWA domain-containing protein [Xanthomonadales bacterium]|nr:VWA domain-containing protein [Xanthomonadales bacterium]
MNAVLDALSQLHFLRPWWLLGLLALPALAWGLQRTARQRQAWRQAVDPHLLPHLLDAGDVRRSVRPWGHWSALLALALALVAMAGPSLRQEAVPLWQARQPLVVAMDLSGAMLARDLPPSRLAQARAKLATLLRERSGGQVALVVFAEDAYTVAPLTDDAGNVALFLDALAPDVMPADGHRADRAIAWSARLLGQGGFQRGRILVMTDRADADAFAEATRARASGYEVSVLGIGSVRGGVFDAPDGLDAARLDEGALQQLAVAGGGRYAALTPTDADLRALGVLVPAAGGAEAAQGEQRRTWRDDGYWLLPLVMVLALPLFRRGIGLALCLLLAFGVPMPPARAQAQPASQSAADGGWWRRADQQAYARMQSGIADYRKGDYAAAIDKFAGNPSADGQYNLGNALAKAGRYDDAIAAYDRALKARPGMADAKTNRAIVDAARKRKPPPGGQSPKQSDSGKPQGQPPSQDTPQGAKDRQNPSPQPQQPGEQGRERSQSAPEPPRDAQQQAQADAAQRRRMDAALRQQQGQRKAQAAGKPQPAPDTAEQRERRLANQAQLQRVPDDPGGLLRARFRLEDARRRGQLQ